jgi:hypothetical protein
MNTRMDEPQFFFRLPIQSRILNPGVPVAMALGSSQNPFELYIDIGILRYVLSGKRTNTRGGEWRE